MSTLFDSPPSPPPPPPAADELAAASHTNEANAETMRVRGKDGEAPFFLALAGFQAVAAGALCADIRASRPLLLRGGALLVRQGFSSIVVPIVALLRHAAPDPVWEAEVTEAARASKFDASEAQLIMAGEIMHRSVRRYCTSAYLGAHAHAEIVAKGDVDPGPSSNGLHNAQSIAGAAAAAATLLSFPTLRGVHATIAAYFFDQIDKPVRRDAFVGMAQVHPPETSLFADPDGTVGPDVFAFCEKHGIKLPPMPPPAAPS